MQLWCRARGLHGCGRIDPRDVKLAKRAQSAFPSHLDQFVGGIDVLRTDKRLHKRKVAAQPQIEDGDARIAGKYDRCARASDIKPVLCVADQKL